MGDFVFLTAETNGFARAGSWKGLPAGAKRNKFLGGLEDWPDNVTCTLLSVGSTLPIPDCLFAERWFLVSPSLRTVLEEHKQESILAFYPLTLLNPNGEVRSDEYTLCEVRHATNAIRWNESEIVWVNGRRFNQIESVNGLVIVDENLRGRGLARVEFIEWEVLVRREVQEALQSSGLTGFGFLDPPEYTYTAPPPSKEAKQLESSWKKEAQRFGDLLGQELELPDSPEKPTDDELLEWADDVFFHMGVPMFEDAEMTEALDNAAVLKAFMRGFVGAVKKRLKKLKRR